MIIFFLLLKEKYKNIFLRVEKMRENLFFSQHAIRESFLLSNEKTRVNMFSEARVLKLTLATTKARVSRSFRKVQMRLGVSSLKLNSPFIRDKQKLRKERQKKCVWERERDRKKKVKRWEKVKVLCIYSFGSAWSKCNIHLQVEKCLENWDVYLKH